MAEEMFNSEQRGHMAYLDTIPPEKTCWCGWYPLGECPHCPAGVSSALKLAVRCMFCHNEPGLVTGIITHRIGCTRPNAKEKP